MELPSYIQQSTLVESNSLVTIPPNAFENGTDEKHGHYNLHTRIEYAMGDFMNLYLHNHPDDYAQHRDQLQQPFYLAIIHTTNKHRIDEHTGLYAGLSTTNARSTEIEMEGLRCTTSSLDNT
eukprot:6476160-Amphidinium_carterae.1